MTSPRVRDFSATMLMNFRCRAPYRQADIVIGLKEAEHQSMVERRFPGHRGPGPELARGRSRCRRALSDALPRLELVLANLIAMLRTGNLRF
jgi:hypothetical protein